MSDITFLKIISKRFVVVEIIDSTADANKIITRKYVISYISC